LGFLAPDPTGDPAGIGVSAGRKLVPYNANVNKFESIRLTTQSDPENIVTPDAALCP
jgi:hypothetical protein